MDSNVGLAIQCVGIGLVTLLSFFMMRSIQGASQRYWTAAWSCLSLSLSSLIVGFHVPAAKGIFYSLYFFGEYAFGYMFAAGCRHHATGARLTRRHLSALAPGALFDVIISSPPSFPGEPRDIADRAWYAGPTYRDVAPLFDQARERLAPGGRVYLLVSSDSDLDLLSTLIIRSRFRARLVAERSIFIESLFIYELETL